jgi:hypothetical protein
MQGVLGCKRCRKWRQTAPKTAAEARYKLTLVMWADEARLYRSSHAASFAARPVQRQHSSTYMPRLAAIVGGRPVRSSRCANRRRLPEIGLGGSERQRQVRVDLSVFSARGPALLMHLGDSHILSDLDKP